MSEDAADEVVRIALNGTEVAIRLTGSGVKNLASLLYEWSRNEKKTSGKTDMGRLLDSNDTLVVLPLDRETYKKFRSVAKNRMLYAAFADKREDGNGIDVVFGQRNQALMDFLLGQIGYTAPVREEDAPLTDKKKETPSSDRSQPPNGRDGSGPGIPLRNSDERESVIERLEKNLEILLERKKTREKAPGKSRGKSR